MKGKNEMILENGRPSVADKREEKEIKVYDFLEKLGVSYARVDHAEAETMEICRDIEKILGCTICKNLLLCNRQKTAFYLLMMPGDKPFETKAFSKALEISRVSFADGEYMEKYLDITPGSLSVLGLMNDKDNNVRLIIDEDVIKEEYIGCHPCVNTSSLKIATKDILSVIIPETKHEYTVINL